MSNRKIYLIGTKHKYQYGARAKNKFDDICTESEETAFCAYVNSVVKRFDIQVIAEELNHQGLEWATVEQSVLEAVASSLNIPHRFCEPNTHERGLLDIEADESVIHDRAWREALSDSAKETLIRFWFLKREMVWLQRLIGLDQWPVLYICGCNHVQSFQKLIATQEILCEVVCEKWDSTK